jgi:hypothetical protein
VIKGDERPPLAVMDGCGVTNRQACLPYSKLLAWPPYHGRHMSLAATCVRALWFIRPALASAHDRVSSGELGGEEVWFRFMRLNAVRPVQAHRAVSNTDYPTWL